MVKWTAAACVVLVVFTPNIPQAQSPPQAVTQPQEWVAFDADYTTRSSLSGRYHRAGDGSTRQEGAMADGARRFISIVNITRKEAYFYTATDNRWRVRPVVYPADGYGPPLHDPLFNSPGLQLRNVERRSQSSDLFEPPADVNFERSEEPLVVRERVFRQ